MDTKISNDKINSVIKSISKVIPECVVLTCDKFDDNFGIRLKFIKFIKHLKNVDGEVLINNFPTNILKMLSLDGYFKIGPVCGTKDINGLTRIQMIIRNLHPKDNENLS